VINSNKIFLLFIEMFPFILVRIETINIRIKFHFPELQEVACGWVFVISIFLDIVARTVSPRSIVTHLTFITF